MYIVEVRCSQPWDTIPFTSVWRALEWPVFNCDQAYDWYSLSVESHHSYLEQWVSCMCFLSDLSPRKICLCKSTKRRRERPVFLICFFDSWKGVCNIRHLLLFQLRQLPMILIYIVSLSHYQISSNPPLFSTFTSHALISPESCRSDKGWMATASATSSHL